MRNDHGSTAVFVHGAGGGGWEWTVWRRVFATRDWKVLAPDLMPVAAGLAETRIEDYERQVRTWCTGRTTPLVLIGASLGGLLAMMAAGRASPAALVLINPLPPAGIDPRPTRAHFPDVMPWGRNRSLAGTRRALPDAHDATILFAFRRWRDESGAVLRAASAGIAVPSLRCPVLVMASQNDDDVSPAASRALADRLGADFRLLADASHVGPLLGSAAAAIAEETRRWCEHNARRFERG